MGIRSPFGTNGCTDTALINHMIGDAAYTNVRLIAKNINTIDNVSENIDKLEDVLDISTEFNEIKTDLATIKSDLVEFMQTYSSDLTFSAVASLAAFMVVKMSGVGVAVATSANQNDAGRVVGLTTAAVSIGQSATVRDNGILTNPAWNWEVNSPLFVGISGALTQIEPTSGFVQRLGIALTATSIFINKSDPIRIG